jgi:hypothetical protein
LSADDLTEEEHALANRYAKDFARLDRPSASIFVFLRSVSWVLLLLCVLFRIWFYLIFERIPEISLNEIGCGRAGCGTLEARSAGAVVIFAIVLLCYLWKRWKWYKALVSLKAKYDR